MRSDTGKVYLVGAGPGDPGLLTLKAQQVIQKATVVLYDYLVDDRILTWCQPDTERIYVGKSGLTGHHLSQGEIEALMVEKALAGHIVCRLKGGDPYLFGRGGEEGEYLARHDIPFEVIPGVTSALAAPTYAGIPVTHRDYASAVTIVTGHEDPAKPSSMLDWGVLAKVPGTLVFLMGVKQLPQLVSQLVVHGKSTETPVALVHWGTRPNQQTRVGTLGTIVEMQAQDPLPPPCVTVVGEVVNARETLNWFETLPLFGKTVVVTRARAQASVLRNQLEALGARVIEFPTIEVLPPLDPPAVGEALAQLPRMDGVVFTSPNGVTFAMQALRQTDMDSRCFAGVKIAAIGPATAAALETYGLVADIMPEEFVAEAVFEALEAGMAPLAGKRFLLPRADIARDDLAVRLVYSGAEVIEVPVYRTVSAPDGPDIETLEEALKRQAVDIITFSSSSTVVNFTKRLQPLLLEDPNILSSVKFASIGPITSNTLQETLGRVDIEAKTYTIPGLIQAIVEYDARQTQHTLMKEVV